MAALKWDESGKRLFETGVDHGVLYVWDDENDKYGDGVAWNGLTGVTESPDGAEANDLYADNIKYATLRSAETFGATIEAYTYPEEFNQCDGSVAAATGVYLGQQSRKTFGFSYRTKIGSDTDTDASSYKLHLVYGCTASPSERSYETINDSPDAITFSWEITSTPVDVSGYKAVSSITIDSTKVDQTKLEAFEKTLYGDDSATATLPLPAAVIAAFATT